MTVHFSKFARHGVITPRPAPAAGWCSRRVVTVGCTAVSHARKDAAWLAKNFVGLAVLEVTATTTT